jgi:hypothetical protein
MENTKVDPGLQKLAENTAKFVLDGYSQMEKRRSDFEKEWSRWGKTSKVRKKK